MPEKPPITTPHKPGTPPTLPPPSLPTLQIQQRKTDQSDSSTSSSGDGGSEGGRRRGRCTKVTLEAMMYPIFGHGLYILLLYVSQSLTQWTIVSSSSMPGRGGVSEWLRVVRWLREL
jgi:hypothetical protein